MSYLNENNIDGLILKSNPNIFYCSGIQLNHHELEGFVLVEKNGVHIITDGRYEVEADLIAKKNSEIKVHIIKVKNYYEELKDVIELLGLKRIGFEENVITLFDFKCLSSDKFELVPTNNIIEEQRLIKSEEEKVIIREAFEVTNKLWDFIKTKVVAGKKESDIVLEMYNFIIQNGGTGFSFDPIIASGLNSTKPHAGWTNKVIEEGDIVTLDFGIMYKNYATDVTKNITIGKVDDQLIEIYNLCLEANEVATNLIKNGSSILEADKISRAVIEKAGYGEFYNHSLGHGVGLQVHESPRLSARAGEQSFKTGQLVTIEPGIYLPNIGGVRVESTGFVNDDGIEILTNSRKLIRN